MRSSGPHPEMVPRPVTWAALPVRSQRHVAVLALRELLPLGPQQLQAARQHPAGLGGVDDVVDVPPFGGQVGVGETLGVLLDQLGPAGGRVGRGGQLPPVDDVDGALRAHDRQLARRPGEGQIGADGLGVHDHVGAPVGLAGDDLDAGDGGLAVGVQQLGPVADDAAVLLVGARHEPRNVDEGDQGDVERVAGAHEAGPLFRALDVEHAGEDLWLVADDTDDVTVDAGVPADQVHGPEGVVLEELAVVDDRGDHLLHVVGLVGAGRDQAADLRDQSVRVVAGIDAGRLLHVVGGQQAEEVPDVVEAALLVGGHEGRHPRLGGVGQRAAELFEGHLLAGDGLDHVGAGDEHLRRLAHHEDEVGHGRAVDGPAGAGAEDDADLRDDAGGVDVPLEDPPEIVQADHAFLDPRPATVVDADDGNAERHAQVHDLVHLLAEDLAERSAVDREVLAEEADPAAVDGPEADDDAVGVGPLVVVEAGSPGAGQHVELLKRALVEEIVDPFPGRHLALAVLALDGVRRTRRGGPPPCGGQALRGVRSWGALTSRFRVSAGRRPRGRRLPAEGMAPAGRAERRGRRAARQTAVRGRPVAGRGARTTPGWTGGEPAGAERPESGRRMDGSAGPAGRWSPHRAGGSSPTTRPHWLRRPPAAKWWGSARTWNRARCWRRTGPVFSPCRLDGEWSPGGHPTLAASCPWARAGCGSAARCGSRAAASRSG